jgi:membrane-associated protease RseP (regulator of RpoE activity)
MKHFLRQYRKAGVVVLMGLGAAMVASPRSAAAQSTQIVELMQGTSPLLLRGSSQGYLGVWVDDVDNEKAQNLKLKEVRGAVITLIDHDAPAGQIGLRVNDVVLQLNGQNVEGAEQLRRMLKEIPAGRKVSLEFSRDGNLQTTSVELVDRRVMEHDVWNKLGNEGDVFVAPSPGMGVLSGGGDASLPGMFHTPIWGSTLNVGAMVEPLTGQMADFLGVPSGLMVKQVAKKSEAATAGLKAFDVILKVGPEAITTMSDWDRALRQNQGKTVQVTILRDKKQQTLALQVDSKHKTSELEMEELFPSGDCSVVAELNPDLAQIFGGGDQAAKVLQDQAQTLKDQIQGYVKPEIDSQLADELRKQAETMRDQLKMDDFKVDPKQMDDLKMQMDEFRKDFKAEDFKIDPQQTEEIRKQAETLRDQLKMDDFKVDQKQLDDLKQQMEQWQKNYNPDTFKIDQKQLDDLKQQMGQWQKSYSPDTFRFDQKQLDDMKKQMEQFRKDYTAPDLPIGPN